MDVLFGDSNHDGIFEIALVDTDLKGTFGHTYVATAPRHYNVRLIDANEDGVFEQRGQDLASRDGLYATPLPIDAAAAGGGSTLSATSRCRWTRASPSTSIRSVG